MKMLRLSCRRGSIDFAPPITGRALWNRGPNIKLWSLHDCETVDRTATDLNAPPSVARQLLRWNTVARSPRRSLIGYKSAKKGSMKQYSKAWVRERGEGGANCPQINAI